MFWGGWEFGEGGEEAVEFVVDELFDGRLGFGCGRWRGGAGFAGHEADENLQVVEQTAGADDVEVVGGDAAEELRGDGEGGGAVFDEREFEGLVGVEVAEFACGGFGAAGGVVEVAEVLVAEGGRATLVSGGVNVAAAVALLGDFGEFGLLWHGGHPLGVLI